MSPSICSTTPPRPSNGSPSSVQAGVLLVNLGTPEAATPQAVRAYLSEFLADPRVIDYPRWLWYLILHGFILRTRPARSARAYARIWTARGSPLRVGSQALAAALQSNLNQKTPKKVEVALAMRYGTPSIRQQIHTLQQAGTRRLLILPLYPQYSATSTGSVLDAVADTLKTLRWPPELRIINDYHQDTGYIEALADSIKHWWKHHGRGDKLLFSFHGIPERYCHAGDPYFDQCQATAQRLFEYLNLTPEQIALSFQSRLGPTRWLQPYTDQMVRQLADSGVRQLDVVCPGFAVDCLETLEEIAMQNRDFFIAAGGQMLRYIPALGNSTPQIASLTTLILRHTQGWPEFDAAAVSRQNRSVVR